MRTCKRKRTVLDICILSAIVVAMAVVLLLYFLLSEDTVKKLSKMSVQDRNAEMGRILCEDITDEGIVLLKNSNNTLPLRRLKKINVFGWAAFDWLTGGYGSGFSNTDLARLKLFPALEAAGIRYNKTLEKIYSDFYMKREMSYGGPWDEYRGDVTISGNRKFILHEPGANFYTEEVMAEVRDFSDTALVVIGRSGGEGRDLRKYQEYQIQTNGSENAFTDETRHYLELSAYEEEMISVAKKCCDKVIVVLNTANAMELGFVDDDEIDACLLVGMTGLTGVNSLISVLKGDVNPSGRTVDTYAYRLESSPSFATSGYDNGKSGAKKYTEAEVLYGEKGYYDAYVDYTDGIYVGYRYYETAAAEGVIDYEKTVQYPFGYGLSYTEFSWSVINVSPVTGSKLDKDGKITVTVNVKNTGKRAGKDVVQLYYTAPYIRGGIEKAHVVLGAFAKTPLLKPGKTATVTLSFAVRDMASYDCYDKNGNGNCGYELDAGEYTVRLMKNSHDAADCENSEIVYTLDETVLYQTDGVTGRAVKNRFTGADATDGVSIDGSAETETIEYMSRIDMAATFPTVSNARRARDPKAYAVAKEQEPTPQDGDMPLTGIAGNYTVNDAVGLDYDSETWDGILKQVDVDEMCDLIEDGYFKTKKIDSIRKPEYTDLDGPGGLNTRIFGGEHCRYVLYPNEVLLAQTWNKELAYRMGLNVGEEARANSIKGWYAPGANIHRSPFGGRNFEYFSEDALLSGVFAAEVVRGAKNKGLNCYIKHFAVNETETMREGLFTWLTEQTLREIYLKPYEIAVKQGGANALMGSMNRIGAVWSGASYALCTEVLRNEWGFRGTVMTDWVDVGKDHMPVFKGLYAGTDLWLHDVGNASYVPFVKKMYGADPTFVRYARQATKNILYMNADTENTAARYDPDDDPVDIFGGRRKSGGIGIVWTIVIESVLAAGLSVCGVFLAKHVKEDKRGESV